MPLIQRNEIKNKNNINFSLSNSNNLKIQRKVKISHIPTETPLCICQKASYTLEAAVLIPIFACFIISILFFFRVLQVEQELKEALVYTGRTMAVGAFAENYNISYDQNQGISIGAAKLMVDWQMKESGTPMNFVDLGQSGICLLASEVSGNYINLKAVYSMKLPFSLFGKKSMVLCQQVKVRKWIGYCNDEQIETGDCLVYVTEHGVVYHKNKYCTHLDLSIRAVSEGNVTELRNKSGKKYVACRYCKQKEAPGGTVYITDYGDSFHTDISCSGLKRSISMKRLSEVLNMPACSKCGG